MHDRVRLMSASPRKPVEGKCSLCGRVGEAVRTGHKVTRDLAREGLPEIGQLCIRCWCGYLSTRQTRRDG
jgi:hypothetical protein